MSLLFETIRIENGLAQNLEWHERRMSLAKREIWQVNEPVILGPRISVPPEFKSGTVRCNIHYGPGIQSITYRRYEKRQICSLKLVTCDTIDYHLKFADRALLKSLLAFRGECDEIIIIKNGFLTDTSMSNIMFRDGEKWVTPANPLLKGTCRERLIREGWLTEREIRPEDIMEYGGLKIINAMRNPEDEMIIPVSQILQ